MEKISIRGRFFAIMTVIALLAICGGAIGGSALAASSVPVLDKLTRVTMYSGDQGGGWMTSAAMFATGWEKGIPNLQVSTVPGENLPNIHAIENSKTGLDIGLGYVNYIADALAQRGDMGERLGKPIQNVRALARLSRVSYFVAPVIKSLVPEGVTTMSGFLASKPKLRLYTDARGSAGDMATRDILEFFGLTYEDIRAWGGSVTFSNRTDGINSMVDGHADGVWTCIAARDASFQELESSREIVWLQIDDDVINYVCENYGFVPFVAPAEWTLARVAYHSILTDTVLLCNANIPDDVAYLLTKVVLENKETWAQGQVVFEFFDPVVAGTDTVVPLHPGAEKLYKELGYATD